MVVELADQLNRFVNPLLLRLHLGVDVFYLMGLDLGLLVQSCLFLKVQLLLPLLLLLLKVYFALQLALKQLLVTLELLVY